MSMTMPQVNYVDRITINPAICHGKPIIRGMRWLCYYSSLWATAKGGQISRGPLANSLRVVGVS